MGVGAQYYIKNGKVQWAPHLYCGSYDEYQRAKEKREGKQHRFLETGWFMILSGAFFIVIALSILLAIISLVSEHKVSSYSFIGILGVFVGVCTGLFACWQGLQQRARYKEKQYIASLYRNCAIVSSIGKPEMKPVVDDTLRGVVY